MECGLFWADYVINILHLYSVFRPLISKEFPEVEVIFIQFFLFILQAEEESLLKNPAAFINPDQPLISGVQLSGNGSVLRWGNECQFLCKLRRKGDSC